MRASSIPTQKYISTQCTQGSGGGGLPPEPSPFAAAAQAAAPHPRPRRRPATPATGHTSDRVAPAYRDVPPAAPHRRPRRTTGRCGRPTVAHRRPRRATPGGRPPRPGTPGRERGNRHAGSPHHGLWNRVRQPPPAARAPFPGSGRRTVPRPEPGEDARLAVRHAVCGARHWRVRSSAHEIRNGRAIHWDIARHHVPTTGIAESAGPG